MTARARRRKIYHRASAIARAVRTADFPDAVNIIASLIAGPMTRKRRENEDRKWDAAVYDGASEGVGLLTTPVVDERSPSDRARWLKANQNLVDALERKLTKELDLPPGLKVEFQKGPLLEPNDVVTVRSVDGTFVARTSGYSYVAVDRQTRQQLGDLVSVVCDADCPRKIASWPGCCKLNDRVEMSDVFEPAGPDSFGGEDGMHSPAAATLRAESENRKRS
jgi:hypothetical protein